MNTAKKNFVPGLERGLRILEILPKSRGGLTLSQLTRHLQLPKSSVHSLLHTLQGSGYVYRDPDSGKYRVSLRVCALAHLALSGIGLREQARPRLRRLAETVGMTAHLAVLEQGSCILIEKVSPPEAARMATWIGKHLSLHCTALGKALAAYLPEPQLEEIVREHGLLRHNDNTIGSLRRLKQELAVVRQRGYALDDEEEELNVRCLGAPIFGEKGQAIAAVSIAGTIAQIHDSNLARLAREVCAAANEITGHVKGTEEETPNAFTMPAEMPTLLAYDCRHPQPLFPVSGPLH